jgi:hypothetical protein
MGPCAITCGAKVTNTNNPKAAAATATKLSFKLLFMVSSLWTVEVFVG